MFKKVFAILLATFCLASCGTPQISLEKLTGKWISTEDAKFVVEFSDSEKIDFYEGTEMARGKFELADDGLLSVGEFEYSIDELDDANLVLLFLPRGNILRFTRE